MSPVNQLRRTVRRPPEFVAGALCIVVVALGACRKEARQPQDAPRLTPNVTMRDVIFYSKALQRDMPYRVVMPSSVESRKKLRTVYLLHGGGGGYHDWTNYSDVAKYAEHGLILVMPEGNSSYYVNAADRPKDRYEDYIVRDLMEEVESRFPAANKREDRAIAGVSMGGFGAVNLALHHPELFAFAGGISAALDVPSRPFSIKRLEQWRRFRAIFGSWKLGSNRQFAALLEKRHLGHEFHTIPGDHNWKQWDEWMPKLFQRLEEHLGAATN